MKATYIEVCGYFLGFVVSCMGGLLVSPAGAKTVRWTWGYDGPVESLVRISQEVER